MLPPWLLGSSTLASFGLSSKGWLTHTLDVPVDHFHNEPAYEPHSHETFKLRYWFDPQYYQPGGPVIVYQGGEANGQYGLPVLEKGIIAQLANATHGVGVVLEHRYYGESIPTPDLSAASLRFLTTQQAVADAAYFAQNAVYPGLEQHALTSHETPYISYGLSYPGAFSAILRTQHPDIYWGAIASSAAIQATVNFWQYYEAIAAYGPPKCIETQRNLMQAIDNILLGKAGRHPRYPACLSCQLKSVFGMGMVQHDDDFARALTSPLHFYQYRSWFPSETPNPFLKYCEYITNPTAMWPATEAVRGQVQNLMAGNGLVPRKELVTSMLNLIGYVSGAAHQYCKGHDLNSCLAARRPTWYAQDDVKQIWRPWTWQYCTQWGFHATGSGAPKTVQPIVSRLITPSYLTIICREAFGFFGPANVTSVNQYGGYRLSYNRLAYIDGEEDPWRPVGPHGFANGAPRRCSTTARPFFLIKGAVHGWDAMGVPPADVTETLPPREIQIVQQKMAQFTKAWVRQWHRRKKVKGKKNKHKSAQPDHRWEDDDEFEAAETDVCEDLISK